MVQPNSHESSQPRRNTRARAVCVRSLLTVTLVLPPILIVLLYRRRRWKRPRGETPRRVPFHKERVFIAVNGPLVYTRLDPIVNPGTCSGHVHSVQGNAAFGSRVPTTAVADGDWRNHTRDVLQTTSNVIPNKSIYWAPSLYIRNPEDGLYYIVPTFSRTYYFLRYAYNRTEVKPFPEDLRIVLGNNTRRRPWAIAESHDLIRWTVRTNRGQTNFTHHADWGYLRRFTVEQMDAVPELEMLNRYPSCLALGQDGKPLTDAEDHRSHAAYRVNSRVCPSTHPFSVPELQMEVRYELEHMRRLLGRSALNDVDNWILANGDITGASAHSDFISGWPVDLMEQVILNCVSTDNFTKDGVNPECPLFDYFTKGNRYGWSDKRVPFTNPVPNETVSPVATLPSFRDACCIGCRDGVQP